MSTSPKQCAVGVAVLGLLVTGCGGSGSPGATPSTAPQPRSTTGVSVDVRNWADYAEDPAVLAYKRSLEATYGSTRHGRALPGVRANNTPALARVVLGQLAVGRRNGWRIAREIPAHVESAKTGDHASTVTICTWSPASSVRGRDGRPLQKGAGTRQWDREVARVLESGGRWRVSHIDFPHTACTDLPAP